MRFVALTLLTVPLLSLTAEARGFRVAEDRHTPNEVSFFSKAPLVTFTGRTNQIFGRADVQLDNLVRSTGEIKIDLSALNTGMPKRDEHMRGVLETDKYRFATFKAVKLLQGGKLIPYQPVPLKIQGELTLHGVTKPLTADVEVTYMPEQDRRTREGDWIMLVTEFPIKLKDFGVEPPGIVPMKVAETVRIRLETMAKGE